MEDVTGRGPAPSSSSMPPDDRLARRDALLLRLELARGTSASRGPARGRPRRRRLRAA